MQSYTVTSDYFKTLGLRMVQGREFTAAEEATVGGTTPVIVDVTLAERLFANENPVGLLLQSGADSGTADSRPMVIVGLAPAVKHDLFENRPEAHIYVPSGAADSTRMVVYALAVVAENIPMRLFNPGTGTRRALFIVIHDPSVAEASSSQWTPSGACSR